MKKDTFMQKLGDGLKSLPKKEVKDILSDYEEHFREGKKKRRKEEDIAAALGDPRKLAKNLKAEYHVAQAKGNSTFRNVMKATLATLGLGLFNIIIVLGPLIGLFAVFIGLYAVVLALAVSGLAVLAAAIIVLSNALVAMGLGMIFFSVAIFALGLLIFLGVNFLLKYFLKGLAAYMDLNVKIIKGEKDE